VIFSSVVNESDREIVVPADQNMYTKFLEQYTVVKLSFNTKKENSIQVENIIKTFSIVLNFR